MLTAKFITTSADRAVRLLPALTSVLFLLVGIPSSVSAQGRVATIVDQSGVSSQVKSFAIKSCGWTWDRLKVVRGEGPVLSIAPDSLVSVVRTTGNEFAVRYVWQRTERSVAGELYCFPIFRGDSSLGTVEVKWSALRSLAFDQPGKSVPPETTSNVAARISLKSGAVVRLTGIRRWASWNNAMFEYLRVYENFIVQRGSSSVTIDFAKVASIDRSDDFVYTVTAHDGTSISGKAGDGEHSFSGIVGIGTDGEYFVEHPKRVDFTSR